MWKVLAFIWRSLRTLAWLALFLFLALFALLYVTERDLPQRWIARIEERVSSDVVNVQIERAAFGLRRGLTLYRTRAFARGSIDQAFLQSDETVVSFTFRPQRPWIEWIDAITLRHLRCNEIPDALLASPANDRTPASNPLANMELAGIEILLTDTEIAGIALERLSGRLSIKAGTMRLTEARLVWPQDPWIELLQGDFSLTPQPLHIRGRLDGRVTPRRIKPLLQRLRARTVVRIGDKFAFTTDPLTVECVFDVAPSERRHDLRIGLKLRNVIYNGVPISQAEAVITGSGPETISRVEIAPFSLVCDAGQAQASLTYEEETETLEINAQGVMQAVPLTRIIEVLDEGELDGIDFGDAPRVSIKGIVGVNTNHPTPTMIEGSIEAAALSLYGFPLTDAFCRFHLHPDRQIDFHSIDARFGHDGKIAGLFSLLPGEDGERAAFRSDVRLADLSVPALFALFDATNAPAGEFSAKLQASGNFAANTPGSTSQSEPLRLEEGQFVFENGALFGMSFSRLSGSLIATDETLALTNLALAWPAPATAPESLSGNLILRTVDDQVDGTFRMQTTPNRIAPLLIAFGATNLALASATFDFSLPPQAQGSFTVAPRADTYGIDLSLHAHELARNGIPINSLSARIRFEGRGAHERLAIDSLSIVNENGQCLASLSHDSATQTLTLDAGMAMPPEIFARLTGLIDPTNFPCLRMDTQAFITAKGTIGLSQSSKDLTSLDGHLDISGMRLNDLFLQRITSTYRIGPDYSVMLTNLTAATPAGGKIDGRFDLTPIATVDGVTALLYRTSFTFDALDLAEVFEGIGSSNRPSGKFSAWIDLHGDLHGDRLKQPNGLGRFVISNGTISRIPLFAGFTDYLARNVPGVETLVNQSSGSLTFSTTNGVISSDNALIEGEVFSLSGKGHYNLPEDQLDFSIQAGIFRRGSLVGRVTRILTLPFTRLLLEFRLRGSVSQPTWEYLGILQRIVDTVSGVISPAGEPVAEP